MKRIFVLGIMLLLVTGAIAYAEKLPVKLSYKEALDVIRDVNKTISAVYESDIESDSQEIILFCQYQLALTEAGINLSAPEDILLLDEDLFAQEDDEVEKEISERIYSVPPTFIESLGYGQSYRIYQNRDYVCIESTIYDAELSRQLEFVRIEVAVRPDTSEMMVLLSQLQKKELLASSNRFLVHFDASTSRSIIRRTFSSDTEYRINLATWADGEDYEWDDKLLYPRASE